MKNKMALNNTILWLRLETVKILCIEAQKHQSSILQILSEASYRNEHES